ncbi:DUF1349 domain-containing protein [Edwardsiella ictaluri]|uniref:DUF1349 domain-containing protein n=1 Tax=Edwardsiella ictaluri TaxID=67780 RepID=A0ABY8GJ22_EDWIC|nr:DUF1349 domain-containing protein [Edwardsiella ictaluri]ELV7528127.1 DUF1349 domain-containing protein [Edwardsiella ictaluri]KMQ78848.1 hypothetical protein ABY58_06375 [Edwardsiella ictaluri]KOO55520.1 hypothetical protein ACS33_06615 [Edwardsiella ictaluri]WFN97328.1 DUF1349 domain-containing protein [Edwardsiella ictaluri]
MNFKNCQWLNEPSEWFLENEVLYVTTNNATDFWRDTHYGFTRHSGHVFGCQVDGDFTLQLCIEGEFKELYDQAGLMIEQDPQHWCKAGIEFSDNQYLMSSVLTNDKSDWATGVYQGNPNKLWMRATIECGVLRLQYSHDSLIWPLIRLCPFPGAGKFFVGAMCCTPERGGLKIRFSEFSISKPLAKGLHDLS